MSVQPIAGVSASNESVVMREYPSIGAWGVGRMLGSLYDSIPLPVFGVKLSHLLLVLPTAPAAVGLYFLQKVFGQNFVLTNRSVQIWTAFSGRRLTTVELSKIKDVEVVQLPGQAFFKAGEILLRGSKGEILGRLSGVPDAPSLANAIRSTAESRGMVQSAMARIEARG